MMCIQEYYYRILSCIRNLFKSSTEKRLEAELMSVDEALGFTAGRTRRHGDRVERIQDTRVELRTWREGYELKHQQAEDLYKQASECQIERDKLKLELRDERKWSYDMAVMAEERGDKIGKLNDEITRLKEIQGARR